MNIYVEILLRTLLAIAVLFVLARLEGPKQVSQLTFYDYIVGITAGSIAATLCIDTETDIRVCVLAVTLFMLSSLLFSFLATKSIVMRRLLMGQPIFLIDKGLILRDGLRRARFNLSDLMRELRSLGYFDINKINYAILESNGMVSVMPKSGDRPPTATEHGMNLPGDGIFANVVEDGKILKCNLRAFCKSAKWLSAELSRQGYELGGVMLATLDEKGELSVYGKADSPSTRTVFQ